MKAQIRSAALRQPERLRASGPSWREEYLKEKLEREEERRGGGRRERRRGARNREERDMERGGEEERDDSKRGERKADRRERRGLTLPLQRCCVWDAVSSFDPKLETHIL